MEIESNDGEYHLRTAQTIMLSITNFFGKCNQIRCYPRIWSHLLKKSFKKNFTFCVVQVKKVFPGQWTNTKSSINN